jgi:hypothetical protein
MPNGRCSKHGGKSLAGIASPRFTTGRWSAVLPTRLAARYQEAQDDPELLTLREDISLLDPRLADVLGRVDTGESGRFWRALQTHSDALEAARHRKDTRGIADALTALQATIQRGATDAAAWDEVISLVEQRRKLVESERRRLVELQQTITVERALVLVGAIAGIIKAHVKDRAMLAAISAGLERLVQQPE